MAIQTYDVAGSDVVIENPVQQRILAELAHGDRQLQDLVEATGKSKSALSGVYMKELLGLGIVVERPHPDDSRRKIFRLNARPATATATTSQYSLADTLCVLALGGDAMQEQARALGRLTNPVLRAGDAPRFASLFGRFAEDEGLAQHLQLDFEAITFRCVPGPGLRGRLDAATTGTLLAGLAEGMAEASGLGEPRFVAEPDGTAFCIQPAA